MARRRRVARWAIPVVIAVLLGGVTAAVRADDRAIGLPLQAVRFECDAWFDDASIRRLLPLQRGEPLTAANLEATRAVLEEAGIFREITIEPRVEAGGAVVVIQLKRVQVLTALRVTGYSALGWREVYRSLRLRTGSFYDREALAAARARLKERYRKQGYPSARVRSRVVKRSGEVEVSITIEEGEPERVEAVAVIGDTGLPAAELQHALRELVGKPHQRDMRRRGERTLLGTLRDAGYYEASVEGEWVPTDAGGGVLWFTVDAGGRSELTISGNTQLGTRTLLEVMDLRTRLIITEGTWREMARRMTEAYRAEGFYRARVSVEVIEGDPTQIHFTVDEGRHYEIRQVRFVGNRGLSDAELRAQMNTQPARTLPWPRLGAFVRPVFDEDLRRLWFFYREQGFAEAEIVDAPITVDDETGAIDITIVIEEGPRTWVAVIDRPELPAAAGKPTYALKVGEPLRPDALEADTETITTALQRDGYIDAEVVPDVERHRVGIDDEATVRWTVTPGTRRTIGRVIVQGNVETRDEIVLRELPFHSGDPLDPHALLQGQDAVYQLGTYRSVAVRPLSDSESTPDVGVEVRPRAPGTFQWGVGYNTRDGFTVSGETAYDNLAHRARRVFLRIQGSVLPDDPSSSQYFAVLGYRDPQFLHSPWQYNVELAAERSTRTIDQYSVQRIALGNGLSRQILPRLLIGGELQVEYADVFDVKPTSFRSEDEQSAWTTAISPSLVYDGRDDPFAPTRGIFDTARFRYAPPGISTVSFGKLNLQHSQAVPAASWLSLVMTLRAGYGRVFGGEEVLPIRERYFLGGATTVRGYAENSLGPTDDSRGREVLGGDTALIANFEARVPVWGELSAAAFLDVGGLFLTQCDAACEARNGVLNNTFDWRNFRKGIGPGLRYMTPVGPISLDYGFKLDRRSGESIGEVHFSISGTF